MNPVMPHSGVTAVFEQRMHRQSQHAAFTSHQMQLGLPSGPALNAITPRLGHVCIQEKINGQGVIA
jgi:hypothetical protein